MKLLTQIGIVFGLYWISQGIERILSFPASVISLLLLLTLLVLRLIKVEQVQDLSDFLLGNLPFFFIPAAAGIINYADVISRNAVAFLVICVVSLVLTFAATPWAVQLTCRLLEKRKEEKR